MKRNTFLRSVISETTNGGQRKERNQDAQKIQRIGACVERWFVRPRGFMGSSKRTAILRYAASSTHSTSSLRRSPWAADRGPNYEKYYKELKQRHGSRRSAFCRWETLRAKKTPRPLGNPKRFRSVLAVKSNYYRFTRQLSERFERESLDAKLFARPPVKSYGNFCEQ